MTREALKVGDECLLSDYRIHKQPMRVTLLEEVIEDTWLIKYANGRRAVVDRMRLEGPASQRKRAERREQEAKRQADKEAKAAVWNGLFERLGLSLRARVQTSMWDGDGAHPEIWIDCPDRERGWGRLVTRLIAVNADRLKGTEDAGQGS